MTTLASSSRSNTQQLQDLTLGGKKSYSLVKWLENSQFDVNNEWFGRLTSVPHANIIDYDPDELKAGMEISVFHNGGEIWRAQVIIPKTSSNTVDLPASTTPRANKIKTKAMGSKANDVLEATYALPVTDSNQLTATDITELTLSTDKSNGTLMLLTNANGLPTATPIVLSSSNLSKSNNQAHKELQFLQTVIGDADGYAQAGQLVTAELIPTGTINVGSNANNGDISIETVLQMQCALLDQQKELKSIEYETMEQLKMLQQNLSQLAKKFNSFETFVSNYTAANNKSTNKTSHNKANNNNNNNNLINNTTNTLPQIKIIDSDLNKDLFNSLTMCSPHQLSNLTLLNTSVDTSSQKSGTTTFDLASYLNGSNTTKIETVNQLLEPIQCISTGAGGSASIPILSTPLIALPINTSNLKIIQAQQNSTADPNCTTIKQINLIQASDAANSSASLLTSTPTQPSKKFKKDTTSVTTTAAQPLVLNTTTGINNVYNDFFRKSQEIQK